MEPAIGRRADLACDFITLLEEVGHICGRQLAGRGERGHVRALRDGKPSLSAQKAMASHRHDFAGRAAGNEDHCKLQWR